MQENTTFTLAIFKHEKLISLSGMNYEDFSKKIAKKVTVSSDAKFFHDSIGTVDALRETIRFLKIGGNLFCCNFTGYEDSVIGGTSGFSPFITASKHTDYFDGTFLNPGYGTYLIADTEESCIKGAYQVIEHNVLMELSRHPSQIANGVWALIIPSNPKIQKKTVGELWYSAARAELEKKEKQLAEERDAAWRVKLAKLAERSEQLAPRKEKKSTFKKTLEQSEHDSVLHPAASAFYFSPTLFFTEEKTDETAKEKYEDERLYSMTVEEALTCLKLDTVQILKNILAQRHCIILVGPEPGNGYLEEVDIKYLLHLAGFTEEELTRIFVKVTSSTEEKVNVIDESVCGSNLKGHHYIFANNILYNNLKPLAEKVKTTKQLELKKINSASEIPAIVNEILQASQVEETTKKVDDVLVSDKDLKTIPTVSDKREQSPEDGDTNPPSEEFNFSRDGREFKVTSHASVIGDTLRITRVGIEQPSLAAKIFKPWVWGLAILINLAVGLNAAALIEFSPEFALVVSAITLVMVPALILCSIVSVGLVIHDWITKDTTAEDSSQQKTTHQNKVSGTPVAKAVVTLAVGLGIILTSLAVILLFSGVGGVTYSFLDPLFKITNQFLATALQGLGLGGVADALIASNEFSAIGGSALILSFFMVCTLGFVERLITEWSSNDHTVLKTREDTPKQSSNQQLEKQMVDPYKIVVSQGVDNKNVIGQTTVAETKSALDAAKAVHNVSGGKVS